ncbi:MAG: hypothetical protein KGZ52_02535 [Xanthomonadaceae bacterium]|nr:hypothetical protein [Xanthomonadaceae bacterium]
MIIKTLLWSFFAVFGSSMALAATSSPPTLPDGPVEGPPGYVCEARGGAVHCRPIKQE